MKLPIPGHLARVAELDELSNVSGIILDAHLDPHLLQVPHGRLVGLVLDSLSRYQRSTGKPFS